MLRTLRVVMLAAVLAAVCAGPAMAASSSPSVSTGAHRNVTQTGATLLGTVNPNGSHTSYYFQWGLTTSYGLNSAPQPIGIATTRMVVSARVAGLIPGTVYHYRVVAYNRFGQSVGRDRVLTTVGPPPPQVATGPATQASPTAVTLTGVVNPNGGATSWRFEYGLTGAYTTFTSGGTLAAAKAAQVVSERVAGLAPGTIFHYRVVAFHGNVATSFGNDALFMTEPSPRPRPALSMRTHPRRAAHRPFVFTTSGAVRLPASIPAQFGCSGSVAIRFFLGRRGVSYLVVPLQPNCTFVGQTTVGRLAGRGPRRLRVAVRFRGNGYLQSVGSGRGRVAAG